MYTCGLLHMDEQRQDDQLEPTISSSVLIRDVALKTSRNQWKMGRGGERKSGISVLMASKDDDDEMSFLFKDLVSVESVICSTIFIFIMEVWFCFVPRMVI